MVDVEKTMTHRGRNSRCVFVATKTILLCSRWSKELKNEKDLYQIQVFPLREETAKDQGQKERSERKRILPSCRFWGQDHRAADGGTDRYL